MAKSIGAFFGMQSEKKSMSKASGDISRAAEISADTQKDMFNKYLALMKPYTDIGKDSLAGYNYLATGKGKPVDLSVSPLYNWQKREGEKSINQQLASRGLYKSGAGMKTLSDFYNQLGAEESDRQLGRYGNLVNLGIGAATNQGNAGLATGNALAGIYSQRGSDLANLSLAKGASSAKFYDTLFDMPYRLANLYMLGSGLGAF